MTSKEARKLVADELRSGKYKQGRGALHNVTEDTYCCLGVACQVFKEQGGELDCAQSQGPDGNVYEYINGLSGVLPAPVRKWLAMESGGEFVNEKLLPGDSVPCMSLIWANDTCGVDFNVIADLFENQEFEYEDTNAT